MLFVYSRTISLILVIMYYCHCIPPDYFVAKEEIDDAEELRNKTPILRSNLEDDKDASEEELDAFARKLKLKPITIPITPSIQTTVAENNLTKNVLRQIQDTPVKDEETFTPIDIFEEYQYIYDDDSNGNGLLSNDSLNRTEIKPCTSSSSPFTDRYDYNVTKEALVGTYDNNSIKYLGDFYNLEPAVSKLQINKLKDTLQSDNIWYVAQTLRCWELPIVYAELGKKPKATDVFIVFDSRLKNVVEGKKSAPIPREYYVPHRVALTNKWCNEGPCYGDHTLCLFSDSGYSGICDVKYTVKAPTRLEKIALVNTLNSIRNRIAHGHSGIYPNLPPAANMKQVIYDNDLERMAMVWLQQCLPGTAPCASLENNPVTMLECTKHARQCCSAEELAENTDCVPQYECFIDPVIGCLHSWFWSAQKLLREIDVECGHLTSNTFNTVQLIWAETMKIGCGFGIHKTEDVRVICNFNPGAPFHIETKYFCGLIRHRDITPNYNFRNTTEVTNLDFLAYMGIHMKEYSRFSDKYTYDREVFDLANLTEYMPMSNSYLDVLNRIYKSGWARSQFGEPGNGTIALSARLTVRYYFYEHNAGKCDTNEPIYVKGPPGSMCIQQGERFGALCYEYRDPTSSYRLVAIVAPIVLFVLILYDLFSSVVRQNYS